MLIYLSTIKLRMESGKPTLLIMMGKSGIGKDTLMNKLVEHMGARLATNMITRPLRDNDPKNYTHVSKQEFESIRSQNNFLSITENPYTDVNGDPDITYYGYLKDTDMTSSDILLIHGTRHSLLYGLIGKEGYNIHTFYLTLDEKNRIERILGRLGGSQELLNNFISSRQEFDDDMGSIETDQKFIQEHSIHLFDMTQDIDTVTQNFIEKVKKLV